MEGSFQDFGSRRRARAKHQPGGTVGLDFELEIVREGQRPGEEHVWAWLRTDY
jgi:hypothetical protein